MSDAEAQAKDTFAEGSGIAPKVLLPREGQRGEKRYVVPEVTVTVAGMDKTMSQTTREEVLKKLRGRYQSAGLKHKRELLD